MTQNPKTYRVITPHGIAWAARFVNEDGAWGRVLYICNMQDTPRNRQKLENLGWQVKMTQPAIASLD